MTNRPKPFNYTAEKFFYPNQINKATKLVDKYCKENNFIQLDKRYTAIDLEMSDLNPEKGNIIQLAFVPIEYYANRIVIYPATYSNVYSDSVSENILNLTHIKRSDLKSADSIDKVLKVINFYAGIHYIGHHVVSDLAFLYYNQKRLGYPLKECKFSDSFYLSNQSDFVNRNCQHHDLESLKEMYKIHARMHNAYNDAVSSALLYYYIRYHVSIDKVADVDVMPDLSNRKYEIEVSR